jgi:hypothetical protein
MNEAVFLEMEIRPQTMMMQIPPPLQSKLNSFMASVFNQSLTATDNKFNFHEFLYLN